MSDERTSETLRKLTNSMSGSVRKRELEKIMEDIKKMERETEDKTNLIKQLRDKLRGNSKKRAGSSRGGNGKNKVVRNGEMDDAFLTNITSLLEVRLLIELSAMPPDGWLNYDDRAKSWCVTILGLLGYVGENSKPLPDFCEGSLEALWNEIIGAMNVKRQDFNSAMVKRLTTKMRCKYII